MKILRICTFTLILMSSLFAQNAEELFENNCVSCHIMKRGWEIKNKNEMIAPTAFAIVDNIKPIFNDKEQYIEFVVDYLENPSKIKSRCKTNVTKQFGVMPKSVSEHLSKEEKKLIVSWMYDNLASK